MTKYLCYAFVFIVPRVQMWMSVLWDLTVTNTLVVRIRTARTPAPVSTHTVERAKTAQVTKRRSTSIHAIKEAIFKCPYVNPFVMSSHQSQSSARTPGLQSSVAEREPTS